MKITRRPSSTIPGLGDSVPVGDAGESETHGSARVTDRVELSEAARLRQRLKTEIGDPTAVDGERVRILQAQVASQTYAPSPRAIADRLLAELAGEFLA